jgi:hypothetical protein
MAVNDQKRANGSRGSADMNKRWLSSVRHARTRAAGLDQRAL